MASLQLLFDVIQDGSPNPCHTFTQPGAAQDDTPPYQFTQPKLIVQGNSGVYRGKLSRTGYKPRIVICKLVTGARACERLKNEASLYRNELKLLQGMAIPEFYGLYMGELDGCVATCILLQDCGVPLEDEAGVYSIEFRILAMEALMFIHKCGVEHGDFDTRNIVVDDPAKPTYAIIVDFDRATRHECQREVDICLYEFEPPLGDFGCRELFFAAIELGIWTPTAMDFRGSGFPLSSLKGPESLVERGVELTDWEIEAGHTPTTIAIAAIRRWLDKFGDRLDYIYGDKETVLEPQLESSLSDFLPQASTA